MFIRTERLLLRPSWPEDLDELLHLLAEEDTAQNLGIQALPRTREELQAYINRPRVPMLPHFFINLRQSNATRLIGGIGLGRDGDEVELGYWIGRAHRGKGYAEEAVRAVLNQARAIGHRKIFACHFADSTASASVLEKSGFTPTGETRERFSAERGEAAPANVYVVDLSKGLAQEQDLNLEAPQLSQ